MQAHLETIQSHGFDMALPHLAGGAVMQARSRFVSRIREDPHMVRPGQGRLSVFQWLDAPTHHALGLLLSEDPDDMGTCSPYTMHGQLLVVGH